MRNRILCEAMKEMNERGIKFTMDDLARRLGVSKRTLYENFASKEEIIAFIFKNALAELKEKRELIINDEQLDIREKFKQIMAVRPTLCAETTDRIAIEVKKFMPKQWKKVEDDMEELWESVESLIREGERTGCFRPVFFPAIRVMFKGAFHEFANHNFLLQNKVTIKEMIELMTDILLFGLVPKDSRDQQS
ncbi:TetR/AcrR family transcriptional regulator|uniref:Transcriptional regulator, TetR family n=1 Tax=Dendrosporobacter quercicolus TaxID=146817 RepID=A0A1G9QDU5_9FIRM|nr:TetR/AcrR family transcriptional regulator [Dendrosporobacter quercicolus]NSL48209.1 TetR/AcrR family transcriptional regulator [Dendrosporobacter quercicolus DSM 1736]SDM09169.1 transcriptional regulator, TetR family [Dendrosporobacter quercicolus]